MYSNEHVLPSWKGNAIYINEPWRSEIDIVDIATSLSRQCRFAGHTRDFYSVAQHCVYVSHACKEHPYLGLMHDATEAYIQDIVRPLRVQLDGAGYKDLEQRWAKRIGEHFGIDLVYLPKEVVTMDMRVLATECRDLITTPEGIELQLPEPLENIAIWPVNHNEARYSFLRRHAELAPRN